MNLIRPWDFIDRKEETAIIDRLLAGDATERVLLFMITAEAGKTYLMRHLAQYCRNLGAQSVLVDFDTRRKDVVTYWKLVQHLCDELGREHFPEVRDCETRYRMSSAVVSVSTGIGDAGVRFATESQLSGSTIGSITGRDSITISVGDVTGGADNLEEAARQDRLKFDMGRSLRAGLTRLCGQRRVVLLLDTYETVSDETHRWLLEWVFDCMNEYYPNLVTVLAGRPDLRDRLTRHPLTGLPIWIRDRLSVPDVTEIQEYVRLRKIPLAPGAIEALTLAAQHDIGILARLGDVFLQGRTNA